MLDPDMLKRLAGATAAAAELAVIVVVGALLGRWLDARFLTSPTFLLLLSIGGLTAGLFRLVRWARSEDQEDS
ncbi:MAG: AtpZ/AtpI family protein [Alphaproteobacteria bacterium]|nr:AtpZ/AtpI family protein [Alphaproteobacteria bacterium]